jgi:thiamine biosynthesis lipoprotein
MMRFSALGLMLLSLLGCQASSQDVHETRFLLGTLVEFTIYTDKQDKALKAITEAAAVMQHIEDKFTTYGDVANTVKQFNLAKVGQPVVLDSEVEQLLLQAISIHGESHGAFDPTLGMLNQLWGFSGERLSKHPPSNKDIIQALKQSGIKNIKKTDQGWVKLVQGLALDFGAIAKGYAIDQAVAVLKSYGFNQAIINAGGDMFILGQHGDKPWRIAIRHPRQSKPLGWIEVDHDTSIVTSGDYERFYRYKGKRYHHIINPKSGYPAHASQSVTVIASNATLADAWSTALFVLGDKQGLKAIKGQDNMQVLWVNKMDKNKQTQGFHMRDLPHKIQ